MYQPFPGLLTERASFPDTLIILASERASDLGPLHRNPQIFFHKINGLQDRKIRISFAAPGASDLSDGVQGTGSHFMGKAKVLFPQRCRTCNNGNKHTSANPRPAGAPESTGSPRHRAAPAVHLHQGVFQLQFSAGIFISGQKGVSLR